MHDLLDSVHAATPTATAVRDSRGAWTFLELVEYSHAFSRWLHGKGVQHGDRIVLQLPTDRELVAMFYGASRRGVVFAPVNPAMKTFHLKSVIANAEPELVIGDSTSVGPLREATDLPVYDLADVWREVVHLHSRGTPVEPAAVTPNDVAALIYTSGSTAAPKAVICPHSQVTFATEAITTTLGYRADDVVFCRFPMSWDYGLYKVLMAHFAGAEIVLAGGESDLVLLNRIRETNATIVPLVPSLASMIGTLAKRATDSTPSLRMFTNTGAALPQSTIDSLRQAFPGVSVVRQFGQTECKRITIMPPEQDGTRPDAVGLPLPGTSVLIVDADGNELPIGQVGEIVAEGPHVMPGYWRNPEQTARAFRANPRTGEPRLHTGDYGRLDDEGFLYFEGRRDDMFKRKGIRMSTVEIEAAAMDIPGVRAAAALPPTPKRDLAVCVESDLPSHTILRELARRLEAQKVPATCHVLEDFPLTLHGKNERKQLALMLDGSDA
ncbi:acyl-CoA synthetase (AMP-forming)/AMP-acid ligase II [Herbihabitans rhizosphaerae]|uniref:Acyl-CoA synthetase (AMP-forming)/AMP-acid ligase II n=1 Tax=Herbihabitans rhizosphaerae TaxID=1872711 RepID=A0A4Q7KFN4_9PSEU|nr:AMP-binding protein [Herbihabitans rhizosphaerae]RZS32713.1 acyl-CoA synthetase (AMP-forming)/AMP-acid ligase II [Herbihabitans rhizosphaerae]